MPTSKFDRKTAWKPNNDERQKIKKLAVIAMFSDDDLFDRLVLKGGNAMDLVHGVSSRSSIDLDFSIKDDIDLNEAQPKITATITRTFYDGGYHAFDINVKQRPKNEMTPALEEFWGGYLVEFKLINLERYKEIGENIETMRREAINLGEGTKFTIDISRHEYIEDKEQKIMDGYTIYVYPPMMIACEKLRAICQQLDEYAPVINRSHKGTPRARDFIDIELLTNTFQLEIAGEEASTIICEMFSAKRVPLKLLSLVHQTKEFHKADFASVQATVKPGVVLHDFEYYHQFVSNICDNLKPLWDK